MEVLQTRKLKKKHSFRLVGGAEMGSQGGEDAQQSSSWQSHIRARINQEEHLGSKMDRATQGSSAGN